ncbi:hypothetical protein, partial [Desulfococcus sp.]|uniref:hypothetical protein n=1 Tax=Desulfococcus sp. TaxID=2025834 RepID=UPI0035936850
SSTFFALLLKPKKPHSHTPFIQKTQAFYCLLHFPSRAFSANLKKTKKNLPTVALPVGKQTQTDP